ncbi:MAG TPA: ORF6N domain-containing protein [Candidatus Limnocylindria bacterium]
MKGKTGRGRRLPAQIERAEAIAGRIHVLRGERVMLDEDLAVLYGVPTKRLNEAVGRNLRRFPPDFMFRLTKDEATALKSQFATSNEGRGGRRRSTPRAFTEEGVAMLSSVLHGPRAVAVNILIMRAFVQLRRAQGQYAELRQRIEELANRVQGHDELLAEILEALSALEQPPSRPARPLGFRPPSTTSGPTARRRLPRHLID